MNERTTRILTMNSGSSSIKWAIYHFADKLLLSGAATGIGHSSGRFKIVNGEGRTTTERSLRFPDHAAALKEIMGWLRFAPEARPITAAGHRIVHGGVQFTSPRRVTRDLLTALEELIPFAPDHLPPEIAGVNAVAQLYPRIPQVVCFDTAFHRTMPAAAQLYPLPPEIRRHGVLRYGFHGLSYEYILSELRERDPVAAEGKLVIAHLGNGASMAAVANGRSMDTTMGFTPAGGLVMSTRSGDLDPGVIVYLLKEKKMDVDAINSLINKRAGLVGLSGRTSDMQELLALAPTDTRAADAVFLFCYQARKFLASLAAVLGGIDTLIFTGGIGEHAAPIRGLICENMGFLGIRLDSELNDRHNEIISTDASNVVVRVIKTNEELMIARHTRDVLMEEIENWKVKIGK